MSSPRTVAITVNVPVEVYQALLEVESKEDAKVEYDAAAEAIFEEIKESSNPYRKITIDDCRNTYTIWVWECSYPKDVFAELKRWHGIKRDDRVLTFRGEEIEEGDFIGDGGLKYFIVPKGFWEG